MDKILIRDLVVRAVIGVYPEERRAKRELVINLTIECSASRAAQSDRIEDAVNYEEIEQRILRLTEACEFNLIETLAERIAQACLEHPGVGRVTVTVDKPGALRSARSVAVEITRSRP